MSKEERLQKLREGYTSRLPARVEELHQAYNAMQNNLRDLDALRELLQLAHSLSGSAGGFGHPEVTNHCRSIELLLRGVLNNGKPPVDEEMAILADKLAALTKVVGQPERRALPTEQTGDFLRRPITDLVPLPEKYTPPSEGRSIYIVDDDQYLAQHLALQLSCYGYQTKTILDAKDLRGIVESNPPDGIVMDIMFPEGQLAGTNAIAELRNIREEHYFPVVFMSARRDLTARLEAVRAGGDEYLPKPVAVDELARKLDRLTSSSPSTPYKVLIIERDEVRAARGVKALSTANIVAKAVSNPLHAMEPLVNLRPDLILIGVGESNDGGIELACAIRQHQDYLNLPFLFVSEDPQIARRLAAHKLGGESFVLEPVDWLSTINTLGSLIERSRTLRSSMVRDSVTGLKNHSRIKEQLLHEIERARRTRTNLTYAIIDIDYFKSVNEQHGHLTGDRVLKSLAHLLQKRLRNSDSVGRYSDDEFAVIMPGANTKVAGLLLDAIRADFSVLRHGFTSGTASLGFSCGIAGWHRNLSANQLVAAADEALYQAQQGGGNQVKFAVI